MTEHAPGWYEHGGERRYWDGHQWTHSTSTPRPPDPPPNPAPSQAIAPYAPAAQPPSAPPFVPQPPPYAPPGAPFAGPGPYGVPPGLGGPLPVARKEPGLSVLASFLLPGLGSIINGDIGAGATLMIVYFLSAVFLFCGLAFLVGLIAIPIMLIVWAGGMIHAYQGAVDFNLRAGYPG